MKRFLGPRPPVLGLVAHMLFNERNAPTKNDRLKMSRVGIAPTVVPKARSVTIHPWIPRAVCIFRVVWCCT